MTIESTAPRAGWHRAFDALLEEHEYAVDQIDGKLPPDLTGTLYRIGPGKWQVGGTLLDHIFDGDGMVSQFTFDGRSIRFRNRYVRTEHFKHGATSNTIRYRGVGTQRPGGMLANIGRRPANVANTNVAFHADKLLALWELGRPHRLDPDTLETLGEYDFDGALRFLGAFSAHPKWDPATGEMFNFGMEVVPSPRLHCYKVDRRGRLSRFASVPLWDLPWNHDMALTQKHMVFALDPLIPNIRKILLANCTFTDALEYRPDKGTRFVLVPRSGGKPRIVEHDALMHFHLTHAFEDGTDTVVDLVLFDDWDELRRELCEFRTRFSTLPSSRLMRYRITPSGKVIEQQLSPYPGEFPQYDWRVTTRRHRYTFLAGRTTATGGYDSVLKIDHDSGNTAQHHVGDGDYVGEPIFVPRTPDAAEDDGWLLAVNYHAAEHRSQLLVLDAADLDRAPLAVAQLPHHIPLGFHGTFTRRIAAPGSPIPRPDDLPTL